MGGFQIKAPALEFLEALRNRPALGVELVRPAQSGRGEEKQAVVARQRFDPDLPPAPIHLAMGEAAGLPHQKTQVGNSLLAATREGE
ncbi:hypothetical protein A8B98_00075 [Hymenobacter sp. UV11]|nr:hypothetical protein A8B98_00075 [Hymenobacter sp. UV11]